MILDRHGGIVWYSPNTGFPASKGMGRVDLKVQSYQGNPVLTWWEGQIIKGTGEGKAIIADTSYRTIATVSAGDGLQVDLHEFVISPQDTALVTAVRPVPADLSGVGGPKQGVALAGVVQEIDIPTGRVLFEWNSLDHVPVTDTYVPFSGGTTAAPFDYFHINSISIAPDGEPAALGPEHQHGLQGGPVDRAGRVATRREAVQLHDGSGRDVLVPAPCPPAGPGHAERLRRRRRPAGQGAAVPGHPAEPGHRRHAGHAAAQLRPPGRPAAANQGSMQVLADGEVLVGWGNLPYFSQFTANGTLILDGQFPVGDQSYRAFTAAWTGHPTDKPAAAARVNPAGGSVVYASWNGATEVDTWTVLASRTADTLATVGSQQHALEQIVTVRCAARMRSSWRSGPRQRRQGRRVRGRELACSWRWRRPRPASRRLLGIDGLAGEAGRRKISGLFALAIANRHAAPSRHPTSGGRVRPQAGTAAGRASRAGTGRPRRACRRRVRWRSGPAARQ